MASKLDLLFAPYIRILRSPLTPDQLQPLPPACKWVQFDAPLAEHEYMAVGRFLERYPGVTLRAYGHAEIQDLAFLRYFPRLRRFQADLWQLSRLEELALLPADLEYLGLGQTKRRHSLAAIGRFAHLRELYLERHTKDLDVLLGLRDVEKLTLRSITMPNLRLLSAMRSLWWLDIKLGGTKDLRSIPEFNLKYLELWQILGLDDLEFLGETVGLQHVFLQALSRVTRLPDLGRLSELRKIHLEGLRQVSDLAPVARAPNLEELVVLEMAMLTPAAFAPFVGHAKLRAATIGLRTIKARREVERLLPLPRAGGKDHFEYR